jgi:hypothetical protein
MSIRPFMRRLLAAALLATLAATGGAFAQEASPISAAQFKKLQKYLDTGAKTALPAPTGSSLGLSSDAAQDLPVAMIWTKDNKIYFCRSELNPADYIVWVRVAGDDASSYMFATHADFKLTSALYLHTERFPQPVDIHSTQIQGLYKNALEELAKVIDSTPPPKE